VGRTDTCGTTPAPQQAWASCENVRATYTPEVFDSFAGCIDASACADGNATARCMSTTHGLPSPIDSCTHLTLWSAACGLAPTGTENDCEGLMAGMLGPIFDEWVACITANGCPKDDDPRFKTCIAPPV